MIVELRVPSPSGPLPGRHTADPTRRKDRPLFVPNPELKLQQQVHEVMRFFQLIRLRPLAHPFGASPGGRIP
jgi:hypothetical protein